MAPREDLVASAIGFLQDPSVSSSPLEKKIEFLKSKNLTQEEIDLSLAQAAGEQVAPQNAPYYPAQAYQRPPSNYNYGYPPPGQWQQQPPQEPPKRDWRDWFIMATVVGGASSGLYTLAQRYVKPLIAPPTPPQLEQDKAAIDEQFNRAFTLLDTLAADTTALKEAEEARTKKLDSTISDVEAIVKELKTANQKREDDSRRMEAEIRTMKDSLPRAIDTVRDASERHLKELSTELASLKTLMSNRMGNTSTSSSSSSNTAHFRDGIPSLNARSSQMDGNRNMASPPSADVGNKTNVNGINGSAATTTSSFPGAPTGYSGPSSNTPVPSTATARAGIATGNKPSIPSWQMAAQNKAKEAAAASNPIAPTTNSTSSSSATPQQDGAEVVNILNSS